MRVLVTGSRGRIGRHVVAEMARSGHEVYGVDVVPPNVATFPGLQVDLTRPGDAYQALAWSQAETVVHMAAWPNAGRVPDAQTYADNVQSTYNVLQACADYGLKRVVIASSAQVYGFAQAPPVYTPVDEAHPLRPGNSYALAKVANESAAAYFSTRYGMEVLAFRLMGIRLPEIMPQELQKMQNDPAGDARLLWTRTDARDAALACRLALEAPSVAAGPYNITGATVGLPRTSAALVETYLADRTEVRLPLKEYESPLSCARAKATFGYRPQFRWSLRVGESKNPFDPNN